MTKKVLSKILSMNIMECIDVESMRKWFAMPIEEKNWMKVAFCLRKFSTLGMCIAFPSLCHSLSGFAMVKCNSEDECETIFSA